MESSQKRSIAMFPVTLRNPPTVELTVVGSGNKGSCEVCYFIEYCDIGVYYLGIGHRHGSSAVTVPGSFSPTHEGEGRIMTQRYFLQISFTLLYSLKRPFGDSDDVDSDRTLRKVHISR